MSVVSEFKSFIQRGNVVDMAIGVIMGGAFGKIVNSVVTDLLTPPLGYVTGGVDFKSLSVKLTPPALGDGSAATPVEIKFGIFLQATFDFLIIAFCVFMIVKLMNRMKKKEEDKPATLPEPTAQEKLLTEIRDLLKARGYFLQSVSLGPQFVFGRGEVQERGKRDREAESLGHAFVFGPSVDADQFAGFVVESSATVAWINGGAGLNDSRFVTAEIVQSHLRQRSASQRPPQSVRITDGEDIITDSQSGSIVPFGGLRFDGGDGDSDQSQVDATGSDPHDRCGARGLAQQLDVELGHLVERRDIGFAVLGERGVDNMPVRDDQRGRVLDAQHDAGAKPFAAQVPPIGRGMDQRVGRHRAGNLWRELLQCCRVRFEFIETDRDVRSFKIEREHNDPTDAVGDSQQQTGDRHSQAFLFASVLRQRDCAEHDADQTGDSEQRRAEQ